MTREQRNELTTLRQQVQAYENEMTQLHDAVKRANDLIETQNRFVAQITTLMHENAALYERVRELQTMLIVSSNTRLN